MYFKFPSQIWRKSWKNRNHKEEYALLEQLLKIEGISQSRDKEPKEIFLNLGK